MENRKYFLANGIPNQPFEDIRCFIVDDQNGGEYVLIQTADIRLPGVQSIAKRERLTPFPEDKAELVSHKTGLVVFG